MSWEDGSGRHEGYLNCVFADGTMGACWSTGWVTVIRDRYNQPLAPRRVGRRSRAAIVGWRVGCDCVPAYADIEPFGAEWSRVERQHWMSDALWTRVLDPSDEDLSDFRIFATNKYADKITERDDVHALAYSVWADHVAVVNAGAQPGRPEGYSLLPAQPRRSPHAGVAGAEVGHRFPR